MKVKWAQLSPLDRAYEKARQAEGYNNRYLEIRRRELESTRQKRERNRYYQLLGHWCRLKRESDAQNSSK